MLLSTVMFGTRVFGAAVNSYVWYQSVWCCCQQLCLVPECLVLLSTVMFGTRVFGVDKFADALCKQLSIHIESVHDKRYAIWCIYCLECDSQLARASQP